MELSKNLGLSLEVLIIRIIVYCRLVFAASTFGNSHIGDSEPQVSYSAAGIDDMLRGHAVNPTYLQPASWARTSELATFR